MIKTIKPLDIISVINPIQISDVAVNDSDKTFVVPANEHYKCFNMNVVLTTTADVGNREIEVRITDAADNILVALQTGAAQAASLTVTYDFDLASILLPSTYKIRVWDKNAIAAAADDMILRMMINKYDT